MKLELFLQETPFLYHLTDRRNLPFIMKHNTLFSTVELVKMADEQPNGNFLKTKRFGPTQILVDGTPIYIRDQRPLNNALGRALLDDWTPEKWIYHLNKRVFTWPNLNRLRRHYATYAHENPLILRFVTEEVLALNHQAELCKINSGDSRCIGGKYGGNPVPRGKDTFKKLAAYEFPDIAEVTFPKFCKLPKTWEAGNSPDGKWKSISS